MALMDQLATFCPKVHHDARDARMTTMKPSTDEDKCLWSAFESDSPIIGNYINEVYRACAFRPFLQNHSGNLGGNWYSHANDNRTVALHHDQQCLQQHFRKSSSIALSKNSAYKKTRIFGNDRLIYNLVHWFPSLLTFYVGNYDSSSQLCLSSTMNRNLRLSRSCARF
ncbi:hypothetical protein GALMADRAFT_1136657 [Galerina marginata CBS 339.88]|uniref:Uncharacterized protein n=1 Tax=Galerina marginata (strain CBS 339.88) TaxID=685588 RepID=A0A067SGS3_GALM3|nr:hypothetical protein GALMADRAFT_1136657 [Galerina marginata CBS 339.88]